MGFRVAGRRKRWGSLKTRSSYASSHVFGSSLLIISVQRRVPIRISRLTIATCPIGGEDNPIISSSLVVRVSQDLTSDPTSTWRILHSCLRLLVLIPDTIIVQPRHGIQHDFTLRAPPLSSWHESYPPPVTLGPARHAQDSTLGVPS